MRVDEIKHVMHGFGIDLCGIAPVDRFDGAPDGFHPRQVMPDCKTVLVFGKRLPSGTVGCSVTGPYTVARDMITDALDKVSVRLCDLLEQRGIAAAPVGSISPVKFDPANGRSRGVISLKHAAVAAGMGRIGRNTLLVTPMLGNLVWLGAVLTDAVFSPDPVMDGDPCPPECKLCIDACPVGALGAPEMDQQACFNHAFGGEHNGDFTIKCYACRSVCPLMRGTANALPLKEL